MNYTHYITVEALINAVNQLPELPSELFREGMGFIVPLSRTPQGIGSGPGKYKSIEFVVKGDDWVLTK